MFAPFFALSMKSPGRQRAFRRAVVGHLLLLLICARGVDSWGNLGQVLMGQFLLVAGIVEGAILVGWRLTQMPKSQALEFMLVTPLRPRGILLAEAGVGLARLALVTLSGLPILLLLACFGRLLLADVVVLLVMPFTWGAITGMGLTLWAYEPLFIRKLAEKLLLLGIVVYLAIGVLVGEHIKAWADWLPRSVYTIHIAGSEWEIKPGGMLLYAFTAFHELNPFGVMKTWMDPDYTRNIPPAVVDDRMFGLEIGASITLGLVLLRTAGRLKGHFHERHYKPAIDPRASKRPPVGDRPLSWWAVKRVTEYAGRANLWLAGGFGILYAAYTIAGDNWPPWLGRMVFYIFDQKMGGIPVLAAALVVLAAVPAAWQYGLWDSNAQDRCRRLELLLLTEIDPRDYWDAASAAAWRRGRGYYWVAILLWAAAVIAGRATLVQAGAAMAAGAILWSLYFALGFRAFSRGEQANGLGSLLTLGVPGATYVLYLADLPMFGMLLPPGSVYSAMAQPPTLLWLASPILLGLAALLITRSALAHCDAQMRHWYDMNHGMRSVE
jgi:hypothetical protein